MKTMTHKQRVEMGIKKRELKKNWQEVKNNWLDIQFAWRRFKDVTGINVLGLFLGSVSGFCILSLLGMTRDWTWHLSVLFIVGNVVVGAVFTAIITYAFLPKR